MKRNSEGKQPKETDAIKKRLEHYSTYQRRIDNQIERLETLEATMGSVSSPRFDGMPGSSDGTSKTERQVLRKMELEQKIRDMIEAEARERKALEALISLMEKPDEQTVIEMRYLDGAKWWTVSAAIHGGLDDYDEHEKRYLKRTFKLHGSALQSLARISKEKTDQE